MAQLVKPFDANTVDPSQGGSSLPVGKHPVVITASEIKPTKDNTGGMLVLELTLIDGPSKGQTGDYRLNLYNSSKQAAEIAHRQLSAICHVTGVYQLQDSQQLHNIPFYVDVELQKTPEAAAKGYTEVKRVYDMQGNEPGKKGNGAPAAANGAGHAAPAQQQPPQQAPASGWGPPAATGQPAAQQPTGSGGSAPAWGAPAGNAPAAGGNVGATPAWSR